MKNTRRILWLSIFALLMGGCEGVTVRKYSTHGPSSEVVPDNQEAPAIAQAQAVATASNSFQLEQCQSPIGVIDVAEDTSQNWYQTLTVQDRLPATTPLLLVLIQDTGCFRLADPVQSYRVSFMGSVQSERDLALYGDLGNDWDVDYTLSPSINFAPNDTGMRKFEAAALTLTDAHSGVQVAISLGLASDQRFSFAALVQAHAAADDVQFGSDTQFQSPMVAMTPWHSTPQGLAVSDAFMSAFNQTVIAAKKHLVERVAEMDRRTGNSLNATPTVLIPIRQAQMRLTDLKFYAGAIDGVAGVDMAKALSAFQRTKGLRVTGQLDLVSSAALAKGE